MPVSKGVVIFHPSEMKEKIKELSSDQFVLKAQIHAGGRGKAGGVKIVKNLEDLNLQAKEMFGKILKTHQTLRLIPLQLNSYLIQKHLW